MIIKTIKFSWRIQFKFYYFSLVHVKIQMAQGNFSRQVSQFRYRLSPGYKYSQLDRWVQSSLFVFWEVAVGIDLLREIVFLFDAII